MDEEEIFLKAIEITSVSDRAVFLTKACGDDGALRHRIESLIRSHEAAGSFLQPTVTPGNGSAATAGIAGGDPAHVSYFGNYEILGLIARGGMGVVYRARQVNLNRIVALKMILAGQLATPDEIRRFQTEAEAAARLDHPNIVPIHETGEHNGLHYFSMGYVEGESLAQKLQSGPLPPAEAAGMLATIADAVQYAHEQGVIHRDLKPSNILVDHSGQPHITDFGLARRTESDHSLTGTGQVLGTPGYMAPEQAQGGHTASPAADIYALGALLYALLTGRPPFQSDNPIDTMLQTVNNDVASPRLLNPRVPRDLEAIVLKALAKRPGHRFASAAEFRAELQRYLSGQPILTRPLHPWRRLIHTSIPARLTLADAGCYAGAAALLAALLVPIVHFGGRGDHLIRCTPAYVPMLIAGAIVVLMSAAASLYRLTLAVAVWLTMATPFALMTVASLIEDSERNHQRLIEQGEQYWAQYMVIGNWGTAGVACLIGGLLAVLIGAVCGFIRQRDRGDVPLRWSRRQIVAGLATGILAMSPAVPFFQKTGTLFGDSYDYSRSLLENSMSVSAAILAFAAGAAFLVGRRFLPGLIGPAVLSAAIAGLNMKSTGVGESFVTWAGLFSVFAPCVVLAILAFLDLVAPAAEGDATTGDSADADIITLKLCRGTFLMSAAIWLCFVVFLWNSRIPGAGDISIQCCLVAAAGTSILKALTSRGSSRVGSILAVLRVPVVMLVLHLIAVFCTSVIVMSFIAMQESEGVVLALMAALPYAAAAAAESGLLRPRWLVWLLLAGISLAIVVVAGAAMEEIRLVVAGFVLTALVAVHLWLLWANRALKRSLRTRR